MNRHHTTPASYKAAPKSCVFICAENQTYPLQRFLCKIIFLEPRLVSGFIFSHIGTTHLQFVQSNLQHAWTVPILLYEKKKWQWNERKSFSERIWEASRLPFCLYLFSRRAGFVLIPWLLSLWGTKHEVSLVIRAFFSVRSGLDERQSGVWKAGVPPE